MATPGERELWAGFARDAMSSYVRPDDIEDNEELVDDMAEVASEYADAMLDEYEERFGSAGGAQGRQARRKGKKRSKRVEEEEE
jgi:hypothetical protein